MNTTGTNKTNKNTNQRQQQRTAGRQRATSKDSSEELEELKQDKTEEAEEEGSGTFASKLKYTGVFLLVLAIWIAIFGILIKTDAGGFASNVLAPLIGTNQTLNKILPEEDQKKSDAQLASEVQSEADAQAAAQAQAQAQAESAAAQQASEQASIQADAQAAAQAQTDAAAQQAAADAQAAEQESIDAEKLADYVSTYSKMDAKSAATILDNMVSGDIDLVTKILANMKPAVRGDILANMDVNSASKLTVKLSKYMQ